MTHRTRFVQTLLGVGALALMWALGAQASYAATETPSESVALSAQSDLTVRRGFTEEAAACIECHARKTPGIVAGWKSGRMAHAGVSCLDCHEVEQGSPMATQCPGVEGSKTFTSPMISPKTCGRCHAVEVEEFSKSGHARLSGAPVVDNPKFQKLMYHLEGGGFMGVEEGSAAMRASRAAGCQSCHGTEIELDANNRPTNNTWPGGVGTRYPDGGIGNCTVCHTRHAFSMAEARKPDACASCHLGPDHPNIEIYENSKHGQVYAAHGEDWNWDAPPEAWEPGDYTAPTCAVCHMSGIGSLKTTHNINERLHWDLAHKRTEVRTGERGDGEKGRPLMRQVCANCHSSGHTDAAVATLDDAVALYNVYWDKSAAMRKELADKGLLKKDAWSDPFQELQYYLWHHTGRRARHGAAMDGPDYAHWHGFFQMFQIIKDMEAIRDWRIEHNAIEELSPVMSSGPQ